VARLRWRHAARLTRSEVMTSDIVRLRESESADPGAWCSLVLEAAEVRIWDLHLDDERFWQRCCEDFSLIDHGQSQHLQHLLDRWDFVLALANERRSTDFRGVSDTGLAIWKLLRSASHDTVATIRSLAAETFLEWVETPRFALQKLHQVARTLPFCLHELVRVLESLPRDCGFVAPSPDECDSLLDQEVLSRIPLNLLSDAEFDLTAQEFRMAVFDFLTTFGIPFQSICQALHRAAANGHLPSYQPVMCIEHDIAFRALAAGNELFWAL
jgi:hypothetical protein